jgi:RNA polymerase sigma-70 factor (ECF subfamily)
VVHVVSSERAAAVEQREFDALVGPHVEAALRLAFAMLGSRAEAEDATQEAITQAWRKLPQVRDRSRMRPWFLAIVANRCRNVRRTRWFSTVRIAEVFRPQREPDSDERIDLEQGLARWALADRQVLFMHFFLDMPVEEVANSLGISTAAAKGRVYRACRRLRPALVEEDLTQ